jgi:hypothetical protein
MDATIDFLKKQKDGDKPMFTVTWFPSPRGPMKETPVRIPGGTDLYKEAGKTAATILRLLCWISRSASCVRAFETWESPTTPSSGIAATTADWWLKPPAVRRKRQYL